jgi:hypothetical protein
MKNLFILISFLAGFSINSFSQCNCGTFGYNCSYITVDNNIYCQVGIKAVYTCEGEEDCYAEWQPINYGGSYNVPTVATGSDPDECPEGYCLYELTVYIVECDENAFVKIYASTTSTPGTFGCDCAHCSPYNLFNFNYSYNYCTLKVDCN